jgi:hypothetical protein
MRCLWYAGFIFSDLLSKFYFVQFRPLFSCLEQTHSFIWGPYPAENGMVFIWKYRIEGSMFTAICIPLFGMDQYCTVYWCKYWIAHNPGLSGVGCNMHFHYCPWTGSIKPSLKYFFIFVMFSDFQSSRFIYCNDYDDGRCFFFVKLVSMASFVFESTFNSWNWCASKINHY